jgi:hypothetical protein
MSLSTVLALAAAIFAAPAHLTCVPADGPVVAALHTPDGHVVVARDGGLSVDGRRLTVCDGLPGAHPTALAATVDGSTRFVGFRREGVWRWDAGGFTAVPGLTDAGRFGGVRALAVDGDTLWVATGSAGLWHGPLAGGVFQPSKHKVLGSQTSFALRAAPGGGVAAAVGPYGAYLVDAHGGVKRTASGFVGCLEADARPAVYCAPATGKVAPSVDTAGLPTAHFTALSRRGGRLFAGTFDRGLFASDDGLHFAAVPGVPPFVNALAETGGAVFVGTARGLFVLDADGADAAGARPVPGLTVHVNALAAGPAGALAVGTAQGAYLLERGQVRRLGEAEGLPGRQVWGVAFGADGALWVGTVDGLARFAEGAPVEVFTQASGHLPHDWVTALLPEGDDLLVGTYDAGVVRLSPDRVTASGWRATPALPGAWVNPMGLARLGRDVVVATLGGGAATLRAPARASLLPAALDDVTAALATPDGEWWFATRGGLVHAPEGWYGVAHDQAQPAPDSPCFADVRAPAGLRVERGR